MFGKSFARRPHPDACRAREGGRSGGLIEALFNIDSAMPVVDVIKCWEVLSVFPRVMASDVNTHALIVWEWIVAAGCV